jgi:hypothetical protein
MKGGFNGNRWTKTSMKPDLGKNWEEIGKEK